MGRGEPHADLGRRRRPRHRRPILGTGSVGLRRARLFETYVEKRYGPDIEVCAGHDVGMVVAFLIGRGERLVFLERAHPGSWGCSEDPDVASWGGPWPMPVEGTTAALAAAVTMIRPG